MCGILGCFWNSNKKEHVKENINNSFKLIYHRGPDNQTLIHGKNWAIGHTRLSIIDKSKKSNQPFVDKDKNFYLSFNGEIYNYKKIRKELLQEGFKFETFSDTEVLFKLLINKGFNETLNLIEGMFAFIFFDKSKNIVFGARDHFGQKPLHYFQESNFFSVCSEVKPLLLLKDKVKPDLTSWRTYLCSNGIIDLDNTFFSNIKTLPAGHSFILKDQKLKIMQYFDVLDLYDQKDYHNKNTSINKNLKILSNLLDDSIEKHLISDVPIGVLTSGGIDSSLILNTAFKQNSEIKTYTKISPGIEKIPLKIIPKLLNNISIKPNFIIQEKENYLLDSLNFLLHTATPARWGGGPPMANVCKLAFSEGTKVLLGGDGVDEACAGYDTHKKIFDNFENDMFQLHDIQDLDSNSQFFDPSKLDRFIQKKFKERKKALEVLDNISNPKEKFSRAILFQDVGSFLQSCNLPHSDSYSMMHSVELRNPFLDIGLQKFILNLPMNNRFKLHNSGHYSKYIFRVLVEQSMGNYLNVHKEGTRNYSMYISNSNFWNLEKFKIREFFNLKRKLDRKSFFKYLNLEFLFRSFFLKEEDFFHEILTPEGLRKNKV